jgi:hypothetical protein
MKRGLRFFVGLISLTMFLVIVACDKEFESRDFAPMQTNKQTDTTGSYNHNDNNYNKDPDVVNQNPEIVCQNVGYKIKNGKIVRDKSSIGTIKTGDTLGFPGIGTIGFYTNPATTFVSFFQGNNAWNNVNQIFVSLSWGRSTFTVSNNGQTFLTFYVLCDSLLDKTPATPPVNPPQNNVKKIPVRFLKKTITGSTMNLTFRFWRQNSMIPLKWVSSLNDNSWGNPIQSGFSNEQPDSVDWTTPDFNFGYTGRITFNVVTWGNWWQVINLDPANGWTSIFYDKNYTADGDSNPDNVFTVFMSAGRVEDAQHNLVAP